ncbi:MAG: glycosyltransferase [Acidobacteria bacterium]|nr:glycosyltransferase [Acidobacteriota bacterium]
MICILHGYLLEGSGSNLWTRSVIEALVRQGRTVHLLAQENHPEIYPFIRKAIRYRPDGSVETFHEAPAGEGGCVLHKPVLGDLLPVYVRDRYEEFDRVIPLVELETYEIEKYVETNVEVLRRVVREHKISAMHANHAVMMSVVAERVSGETGVPFAIMPHGSGLEYAVRPDPRMKRYAESAFAAASRVFVIGDEMQGRVLELLGNVEGLEEKLTRLPLGVDTSKFEPVEPSERKASIRRLYEGLQTVVRGRPADAAERMRHAVASATSAEEIARSASAIATYELKKPDEDIEARLESIDWTRDEVALFVGRLIAAKGPQNVIAALPFVFRDHPGLRLILIGHGPLREPLEAMVLAMHQGRRDLFGSIVEMGRRFEEHPEGSGGDLTFHEIASYLRSLEEEGRLEEWWDACREHLLPERIIFGGYLTHAELRYLFGCADVAIFPSLVKEAGPLVFLEAMASGIFPLGTYFGGMKASIDATRELIGDDGWKRMQIDPEPSRVVGSIASQLPLALECSRHYSRDLRSIAVEHHDWRNVAETLSETLGEAGIRKQDSGSRGCEEE